MFTDVMLHLCTRDCDVTGTQLPSSINSISRRRRSSRSTNCNSICSSVTVQLDQARTTSQTSCSSGSFLKTAAAYMRIDAAKLVGFAQNESLHGANRRDTANDDSSRPRTPTGNPLYDTDGRCRNLKQTSLNGPSLSA